MSQRGYNDYRLPALGSPDGSACPYSGSNKAVAIGVFPVYSIHNQISPSKANIVANALSRSQCGVVHESTKAEAKTTSNDNIIFVLSGVLMDANWEDLHKWQQAYKDDPSLKTVYEKLR